MTGEAWSVPIVVIVTPLIPTCISCFDRRGIFYREHCEAFEIQCSITKCVVFFAFLSEYLF